MSLSPQNAMTLKEWHQHCTEALQKAGLTNAAQEAKWLLAGALQREGAFITLNPSYRPSAAEEQTLQEWLTRRSAGEPLSRLKGMREFWSLPFFLNEHTLDPRPDTEILVEGVLKWVGERKKDPWRILDLGTGSGCILISLLHELPNATGLGVDISPEALSMAHHNATLNGVEERAEFRQSHWTQHVTGTFDIIVSNPPYIPLKERETLSREVISHDPSQALFGGEDGLACYRQLASQMGAFLNPQGLAVVEMGQGQREDIQYLFQEAGFKVLFIHADLAGIERVMGVGR